MDSAVNVSSLATVSNLPAPSPPNECTPMLRTRPVPMDAESILRREGKDEMPFWERVSSPLHPVFRKVQEHCHYEWVAALLSAIMLLTLFVFIFYLDTSPRPEDCVTPFGHLLGESRGVKAFSNCNRDYRNVEEHFVLVRTSLTYSGLKWRSVEYARRFWLLAKRPAVQFMSVQNAEDIWTRVVYASYITGERVKLFKYENMLACDQTPREKKTGMKRSLWKHYKPQIGDLLVYANDSNIPGGHVAVVVDIVSMSKNLDGNTSSMTEYSMRLAEQNWNNEPWPYRSNLEGKETRNDTRLLGDYSREVSLQEVESAQMICVKDPWGTVLGWVRA
ncbi:hypothetical protein MOQ_009527 [Trypanosoma cruzi marinkellei]|uniref:Uncharacterized protein n=1 Tax=Trypanosoma cruzi marinkellei TaxID=85056 RepID=K2NCJ3_TRYCR|nr:hypothetical protein MOQ_009527 [Trypanosoma cruzi marinkellei]